MSAQKDGIRRPDDFPTRSIRESVQKAAPADPASYPFLRPAVEANELGRLGEYRVLRLLGTGGMGMVFLAEDIALGRPVALKVMKPDLAQGESAWKRFLREARTMAAIKHDNLVTIFQVGQDGDAIYLAMELLEGETLEQFINSVGQMETIEIVRIANEIAGGLAAIHERGHIHRDIKPGNIWLETRGGNGKSPRVKILDFGLARGIDDTSITRSGMIVGTPAYMSPEQARGKQADMRSDLFSLGCVMYAMCTGKEPFRAENTMAQLAALMTDEPTAVSALNAQIAPPLADLVMELLSKNPDDRPASAAAVSERLRKIKRSLTNRRRKVSGDATEELDARRVRKSIGGTKGPFWRRFRTPIVIGSIAVAILAAIGIAWISGIGPVPPKGPGGEDRDRVFLTEMRPTRTVAWPWSPPKDDKFGPKRKDDKFGPPPETPPLSVNGEPSPHGIFMHATPPHEPPPSITYRLGKRFDSFHTRVALNDSDKSEASVVFCVYVDGTKAWESQPVDGFKKRVQDCTLSVKGIEDLKLEVRADGDIRGNHPVWIEPVLKR